MPILAVCQGLAGDIDEGPCIQIVNDAAELAGHLAEGHLVAQHHAVALKLRRFGRRRGDLRGFGGFVQFLPQEQIGLGFLIGDVAQRGGLHKARLLVHRGHDGPHFTRYRIRPLIDNSHQLVGFQALHNGHIRDADAGTQGRNPGGQGISGIGGRGRTGGCRGRGAFGRQGLQGGCLLRRRRDHLHQLLRG